jgi:hypothetical protein
MSSFASDTMVAADLAVSRVATALAYARKDIK